MSWSTMTMVVPASRIARSRSPEPAALGGVEPGSGLVEQHDRRAAGQRAGDGDELALADRQLPHRLVGDRLQVEDLEVGVDAERRLPPSARAEQRAAVVPTSTFSRTLRSS